MTEHLAVGLNIPAELLPTIYHALQSQGERGVYRELADLERDQAECRERGDCPSCGLNVEHLAVERHGWSSEITRLVDHAVRLQEEILSQRRQMDRQAAEIVRLERTTLQPVAGYLAARALLEQAEAADDWSGRISPEALRDALDSPF